MARKIKRLKSSDINRNSSIKISHTIEKIKAHERRYMLIVASMFMVIFLFIGYFLFRVNYTDTVMYSTNMNYLLNSSIISITEDKIMSDVDGLKTDGFGVTFYNAEDQDMNYELVLQKDNFITGKCGCTNEFNPSFLKYSIDGVNVYSFTGEDMIVSKGKIDAYDSKEFNIKLWYDSNVTKIDDYHFHGRFVFRKIGNC